MHSIKNMIIFIKSEADYLMVPVYNSLGFIVSGVFGLLISLRYLKFTTPSLSLTLRLFKESSSLFISNFAPFIHEENSIPIFEELERAIKNINRNANAKVLFFELSLQIAVLLKVKLKFAVK
mgnify:CR=1 FL=1